MAKKPKNPTSGTSVSATEAARNFSELLNRVRYQNKAFVVERGGDAVCEIRPVYQSGQFTGADLARLLATLPDAPQAYLEAVEEGIKEQPRAEDTRWQR
jgi:hypothetical protein